MKNNLELELNLNLDFDLYLFNKLSNIIVTYIYKLNNFSKKPEYESNINTCCDDEDIKFLLPILKIIQLNNHKPTQYTKKYYHTIMYTLLLYLYYSLVLGEQTDDYIDSKVIFYCICKFWGNMAESRGIYKVVETLYIDICTSNNLPYYSQVRRMFFGMNII